MIRVGSSANKRGDGLICHRWLDASMVQLISALAAACLPAWLVALPACLREVSRWLHRALFLAGDGFQRVSKADTPSSRLG